MINSIFNFFKTKPDESSVDKIEITSEIKTAAKEFLATILEKSNFNSIVAINNDINDVIYLMIEDENDTARIIGKDGQTLFALQSIVQSYLSRAHKQYIPVFIDSNEYLASKIDNVQQKAKELEKKLSNEKRKIECFPMSSFERRAIHTLYKDSDKITTYSIGEGDDRRIVMELKN